MTKWRKLLYLAVVLGSVPALGTTFSASLKDIVGQVAKARIEIKLVGCTGYITSTSGNTVAPFYVSRYADGAGSISLTVPDQTSYSCANGGGPIYYHVSIYYTDSNGLEQKGPDGDFDISGSAFVLNSATPRSGVLEWLLVNLRGIPLDSSVGTPTDGQSLIYDSASGKYKAGLPAAVADWNTLANKPSTFPPSTHTHVESDVTSLVSDLAAKAALASPALSGSPTSPTQAQADNSTKIATTAYVDTGLGGKVSTSRTVNGKALSANITLGLASSDFANQGTTTTILHGNAAGNPSFGGVVLGDLTATGSPSTSTYLRGDFSWATVPAAGIGDPGSNGIVKRTSLNNSSVAASSDVLGLFSGTCSSSTFLRGDGSCQTPGGGGNVSNTGTPATGQIPVWQSATTQSGVTNLSLPGDVYANGRPWVDVRVKGAVCDGATDDLTAINNAVTLASSLATIGGSPYGAAVFIPPGSNCMVSAPIVLPKGTNTLGNGAVSVIGAGYDLSALGALSSFPTNRCIIEWTTATTARVLGVEISGITFKDTTVDKQCDIGYSYSATNSPVTTSNATNERQENLRVFNVVFQGSNQYQDKHFKIDGDCYYCNIDVLVNDSRGSVHNYDTIAVWSNDCYTASAPNNETCGFTYGHVTVNTIGNRGGYNAAANLRSNQAFVGGFSNGVYNTNAWRISNSFFPRLSLITEGLGGQPEVSIVNTSGPTFERLDIGAPSNEGAGIGNGAEFVNSPNIIIERASAANGISSAWSQQTTMTTYSGLTGGSSYTSAPTWAGSGGVCLTQPSGTTTLTGNAVATLVIVNAGACQTGHAPTIAFTGGGGTGAAATATMTSAGLFQLKFDSASTPATGWDIHTNGGSAEVSLADTTKQFLRICDQTSSLCNTYTAVGSLSGVALPASSISTGTVGTARLGSGSASSSTFLRGDQTWATVSGAISGLTTGTIPKAASSSSVADSLLLDSGTALSYAGTGGFSQQVPNTAGTGFLNIGFPGTNGTSRILHDYVNQDTTGSNVMGHWFDNIVSTTFNSVIDQIRVEGWNVTPGGGKSNSAQTMIADQWESNYWPDGVTCQMERHILLAGSSGSPVRPFTMANNCSDGSTRFMTFSSDTGVGFNYLTGVNAGVQYIGLSPTAGITSTAGMGINSGTFINSDNSFTLAPTTLGGASPSNRTKQYSSAISGTCPNAGDIAWPGSNTAASPDYYICHVAAGAWIANGTGTLNANFGEYVNAASTGTQPGIDFRQIGNGGIEVYSTYTDVNNNCGMLISPLGSAPQANFYNVGFRRGTCTDITTAVIGGWTGVAASLRGGSTEAIAIDSSGNPTLKNTVTVSGATTHTVAGALSASPLSLTGNIVTGGTGTTNFPDFYINNGTAPTTWNTSGTYLGVNAITGFTGNFVDLRVNGGGSLFTVTASGSVSSNSSYLGTKFNSSTNCSSSASPAVCSSASSGSVVIAAAATTVQVNSTAVTANSQISITFDESLGTKLSVTCNSATASEAAQYFVSARTAATNFTIKTSVAPTANPACLSYTIEN